jgi:CRISPR-associated protein Csh2
MPTISQRSEILFLYDCKNCNPNGDPNNANEPRMNEYTGQCLVTDVRLKRTVRDYLIANGHDGSEPDRDVFIRDFDGVPTTSAKRAEKYKDREEFIRQFIDVRLFGGVSAPKKSKETKEKVFNLTGPVQFGMGTSLHPVRKNFIKGTGAFAPDGAQQRTFREEFNITYGLIGFHGVINELAAQSTGLTDDDVAQMMDALWKGTKGLLSRSKKGHMPRLLVKVDYTEPQFFIGDLLEYLRMDYVEGQDNDTLTDTSDYVLDVSRLNTVLDKHRDKIGAIHVQLDDRLQLSEDILRIDHV